MSESTYQPALSGEPLSFSTLPTLTIPEREQRPALSAQVLSPAQSLPQLNQTSGLSLGIEVPAFGARLTATIANLRSDSEYRTVVFESAIDADVMALLTLHNERGNGAHEQIQIKSVSLRLQIANHKARTHFISDSLYAMLGLAGPITLAIPNINVKLRLNFDMATREISKFLQLRQLEFGLMVIGKACGREFEVPAHISGEEVNSISFSFYAILAQQFEWRVNEIVQPTPATQEMLSWLDNLKPVTSNECVYKLMFGPSSVERSVLGHQVALGEQTVFLDDAVIENRDLVRKRLAMKDGQIVPIKIVPRSRKGKYVFRKTPTLPDKPWDDLVERLTMLEDSLDEQLTFRYHELAKSTVEDLTTDEIEVVMKRPELTDDSYLIRD